MDALGAKPSANVSLFPFQSPTRLLPRFTGQLWKTEIKTACFLAFTCPLGRTHRRGGGLEAGQVLLPPSGAWYAQRSWGRARRDVGTCLPEAPGRLFPAGNTVLCLVLPDIASCRAEHPGRTQVQGMSREATQPGEAAGSQRLPAARE